MHQVQHFKLEIKASTMVYSNVLVVGTTQGEFQTLYNLKILNAEFCKNFWGEKRSLSSKTGLYSPEFRYKVNLGGLTRISEGILGLRIHFWRVFFFFFCKNSSAKTPWTQRKFKVFSISETARAQRFPPFSRSWSPGPASSRMRRNNRRYWNELLTPSPLLTSHRPCNACAWHGRVSHTTPGFLSGGGPYRRLQITSFCEEKEYEKLRNGNHSERILK